MDNLSNTNINELVNYIAVKDDNLIPQKKVSNKHLLSNKNQHEISNVHNNNTLTDKTFNTHTNNSNIIITAAVGKNMEEEEDHDDNDDDDAVGDKSLKFSQNKNQRLVKNLDSDILMKKGLTLLLEGAKQKKTNIQEFQQDQSLQLDKYHAFSSLCNFQKSQSITGNIIHNVAKKQELDTIIQSIDLNKRCAIIFDEKECKTFIEKNKKVILCTAYNMFKKNITTKLKNYTVKIKKLNSIDNEETASNNCESTAVCRRRNHRTSGINLSSRKDVQKSEIVLENDQRENGSSYGFRVDGMKYTDLMTNFVKENNFSSNKRIQKEMLQDEKLPPEKRQRLDLTTAKNSIVFSQLRRMDHTKPLYRKNKTFWQFDHSSQRDPVEVVGWYEPKPIPEFKIIINEAVDKFYLPHSFQHMAKLLMNFFRGYLVQHTSNYKRKNKLDSISSNMRVLIPQKDMSSEYKHLTETLDNCLMTLISVHTDVLSDTSTEIYRQKFRRYCIFSFCIYLLNAPLHAQYLSPLPYNYFNFYSYLFAHGPELKTTSFLNTMCFLNNNIFKLYRGPATESVQRLIDLDYAFLKGGKSITHSFGSPSKTSIHTRTLVSFMMYSEYMMRVFQQLLEKINQADNNEKYKSIEIKTKQNLSRLCEGVLFIFFSFVFFHRISAIRQLTNWSALRLILGQPHLHDSKSKAKTVTRVDETATNCVKIGSEENFMSTTKSTHSNGLFFSHAHILGLPYGIQSRLGVPLEKINPILLSSSLSSSSTKPETQSPSLGIVSQISDDGSFVLSLNNDNDNNNNNNNHDNIIMCGIDLPLPPPPPEGYCSKLVKFDNIFSEQLNEYYDNNLLISNLAITVAHQMRCKPWTSLSLVDTNKIKMKYKRIHTKPPSLSDLEQYKLLKDTLDYFTASPLKDVFILSSSKRILSLGDLALLALWIKISVLHETWDNESFSPSSPASLTSVLANDRAVTVSESWLSGLCRQLIRIDLVNFGIWGDVKIDLKLDIRNNILHKNNVLLPKERDKIKYTHAILSQRKSLAELHCKKNIKTKTHLGRVTATSWVVCALKKISNGDPDIFLKLLEDVGVYHLSHMNPANTYVYFSDNCLSNEDQMGLNGYMDRMKNTDGQLVLHESAKKELTRGTFHSTNKYNNKITREKANAAMVKMIVKYWASEDEVKTDINCNIEGNDRMLNSTETLWRWPYTPGRCLIGKRIPLVCKQTRFLNYCISDSLVSYKFNDPTSSYHLLFKITNNDDVDGSNNNSNNSNDDAQRMCATVTNIDTIDDVNNNNNNDKNMIKYQLMSQGNEEKVEPYGSDNQMIKNNTLNVPIEQLRDKLSSSAVITTSKNIHKFNKLNLAKSQKDKETIKKHIKLSKIASNINKIPQRQMDNNPNVSELLSNIEPSLLMI
uniref:Wsv433-like protein n=1 Tax=Marsupenaeus japonicus endogenous nimavirus TaxID=2133793 RepID=A0A401IP70_9VIRU|nr:wsv433-like protein [Marsupenaeus japonicus endogenous nimavirus]